MKEYTYSDIKIGLTESFRHVVSKDDEDCFRELTGDVNPMHYDDDFASEISGGRLEKHVCFGMLTASLLSTLAGVYIPGKYSMIHSIDTISFHNPVYVGEELTITGEVIDKSDAINLIVVNVRIVNSSNKTVMKARMKIIVQR